ncbi:hypothetical protein B0H12DRAFT_1080944 [Mycena haematopus]|nr:hypothetical protein B0H12DRAFT_1080944 [Mycena haematopus]
MGSYASIMNDLPLNGMEVDTYIKFTTNPPAPVTGLALVTATTGVVAALPNANVNGEINVIIDQDSALDALGLAPGALSLGPLLGATIGVAAIGDGYLILPEEDIFAATICPSAAQFMPSNSSVTLFAGSSNLTTAANADGDNRTLFVESILGTLDARVATPIASTDSTAAGMIDEYEAMIQSEDTSVFTTQVTANVLPSCAFAAFMAASLD